eukprot:300623-Pleurochrysis_carterae.AAC.1
MTATSRPSAAGNMLATCGGQFAGDSPTQLQPYLVNFEMRLRVRTLLPGSRRKVEKVIVELLRAEGRLTCEMSVEDFCCDAKQARRSLQER